MLRTSWSRPAACKVGSPEAWNPSLSPPPESLFHKFTLGGRIYAPEGTFTRFFLAPGHFHKISKIILKTYIIQTIDLIPAFRINNILFIQMIGVNQKKEKNLNCQSRSLLLIIVSQN